MAGEVIGYRVGIFQEEVRMSDLRRSHRRGEATNPDPIYKENQIHDDRDVLLGERHTMAMVYSVYSAYSIACSLPKDAVRVVRVSKRECSRTPLRYPLLEIPDAFPCFRHAE
jgi:hypothetical protein